MFPLAIAFDSPLLWAVLIGWILSVVLHEFAHGVVAYWGGDYTIKERGGLTLNPLQYIDPLGSILLPAVFLMMGGIPLPGGVTYVDHSLLRNRLWESAVALAGPAMNMLLFLLLALIMHPRLGLVQAAVGNTGGNTGPVPAVWSFLGAMVVLQFFAVIFNLIPIPPLDGFQTVSPWMGEQAQRASAPPIGTACYVLLFLVLRAVPNLATRMFDACANVLFSLGFDYPTVNFIRVGFNTSLYGSD